MELAVHELEPGPVVAAEVGDGFVIGGLPAQQPAQLEVAMALALEDARGAQPLAVAVKIEAEQIAGVIGRTAGVGRDGFGKTEGVQIQLGHEGVEEAHRMLGRHVVLDGLGQELGLRPVLRAAVFHAGTRSSPPLEHSKRMEKFSHKLALQRTAPAVAELGVVDMALIMSSEQSICLPVVSYGSSCKQSGEPADTPPYDGVPADIRESTRAPEGAKLSPDLGSITGLASL